MLLTLSTHHSKKIAFFLGYLFFISGLCSFVYGRNHGATEKNNITIYSTERTRLKMSPVVSSVNPGNTDPIKSIYDKGRKGGKRATMNAKLLKNINDIGGPSQPEMSAFKPVGADNMVDPFTGDFSYNIPLLDVGGYPVNIFYSSGITMDQEASWVGLGWNINPGTIMRNMRGLPDDFDGTEFIEKTQYTKPDKTWGVNVGGKVEIFGGAVGVDLSGGIFFNNMRGLGMEAGLNPALSIGAKSGDDKTSPLTFGWQINANSQSGGSSTFSIALKNKNENSLIGGLKGNISVHSRQGLSDLHLSAETNLLKVTTQSTYINAAANNLLNPSLSTSISFAYPSFMPAMRSRRSSESYDVDLGFGAAGMGFFPHGRLGGYYSRQWIKDEDVVFRQPAFGMLYYKKGQEDKNALMDFNRLNDGGYTPGTPAISVPVYTYDVYSINGEGTGGSFRAYRGDLGFIEDSYLENDGFSGHLGFEAGAGLWGHGAINATAVLTPSSSGGWQTSNLARVPMRFRESNKDTQAVYFKNPGEKAIPNIGYQEAIGGEDLVRLKMINTGRGTPTLVSNFVRYSDMLQKKDDLPISTSASIKVRDKRTQVISFLTASEADRAGLNRKISYIRLNEADSNQVVFGCSNTNRMTIGRAEGYRRPNHVSEINVLMQDGRRYVYDIPVYNTKQVDVTFNKPGSGAGNGANSATTSYSSSNDIVPGRNDHGKDGYIEKQEMPPYAHSYLLTGLLSPNYVDVKGDGITEDDMGDAIKFNYSKSDKDLKWKTPTGANTATLSEGLKTDKNDDKAHYIYGEREVWYLYSIESKNMVARFYVKNDRKDSRAVQDENGAIDENFGAFRLSKISLFTKGELLKNSSNPKPVKTVHFEYDYSLCPGAPGSVDNAGKLTLKTIYFTYNGNKKSKRNYYRFRYPEANNPAYSFTANDRWGNYKPNPGSGVLSNADFPYTDQNLSSTNNSVKAWTMNQVILPSGAAIDIDYESDDYAFVQDRRASAMVQITGFGTSSLPSVYSPKLYDGPFSSYDYIYITVPRAITATTETARKEQIKNWYLANFDKSRQIYMKLAVNVPADKNGSGYELIPVYAEVEDFDTIDGTGGQKIYIKVKRLLSDYSPMVHYVLQFLKSNLPSKAYPGYDVSEEGGIMSVVKAMGGLFHSFKEVFGGGMKLLMQEKRCRTVDLGKSYIRLTDPYLKKLGGGLRVKKVVINDNWDKMTKSPSANDGMINATYGQEYFYTKKELVNGELMTISSGVASWEPSIGADENSYRQAIEYYNKTPKADYDYRVMETPIPEMMYPSAMVGYSRVETRSIHRDTVKNAPGISVTEFYTTREFPTTSSFTPLSEHNAEDYYKSSAFDRMVKADTRTAVALSQGFKVDLNDMNGKMKKQSTYSPNNLNDPISYTENFYSMIRTGGNTFKLNHSFPVIAGPDGKVQQSVIGREIEVMTDFREHKQQTITTNVHFNMDVISGLFVPIPIPTTWKPITREFNLYRSASVLKIVNHYSMLDSVVAVDKGSMVSTKNLVYDAETGDPLLTRTNNEHNQPVYSFAYPAHWAYSGMGLAYKNIDVILKGVTFRNGSLDVISSNANLFESGDELLVTPVRGWQFVLGKSNCEPLFLPATRAIKIWAVNTAKVNSATPQWIFMDANGTPFTAANVDVKIIRSGKRNMFGAGLGSITTLSNPVNPSTGQLAFNDATNIIQTAAATYKDHWRVDNSFFKFDSVVRVQQYARVKLKSYTPADGVSIFAKYKEKGNAWIVEPLVNLNPTSMLAYRQMIVEKRNIVEKHTETQMVDHWLKYNLIEDPIPSGAVLYKAKLSLASHRENHYTNYPSYYQESSHSINTPHWNRWGSVNARDLIPNRISMYRMSAEWPTGTLAQKEAQWRNIFKDWYGSQHDWSSPFVELQEVPMGQSGWSSKSYLLSSTGDGRISIPNNQAERMLTDAAANRNTAIRAFASRGGFGGSIIDGNKHGEWTSAQQCFNLNSLAGTAPLLQFYYYQCGDTATNSSFAIIPGITDTLLNKLIQCEVISQQFSQCRSKFTQRKSINPYVEGVWGNWRVDTSFVYYGERKEDKISDGAVDLRKGGTIKNYQSFWNFAALSTGILARNFAASGVWVWNSTITQYNRKGYEIENKDPLGRFNAGLYGYNQQLPVSVVNNSRYMESMFDGFEDYDYQSNSCTEFCKPVRHVRMDTIQAYLNGEQKHTGKKSLKLNAGQSFSFSAPVVSAGEADRPYSMRVRVDSTSYSDTVVTSSGNGLYGDYIKNGVHRYQTDPVINLQRISRTYRTAHIPPPANGDVGYHTVWTGFIQPKRTGQYYFQTISDDRIKVLIGGTTLVIDDWDAGHSPRVKTSSTSMTLKAGVAYQVQIDFEQIQDPDAAAVLLWKNEYMSGFELIPQEVMYTSSPSGNVQYTSGWCTKPDSVNVRGNALTDTFSLVQNKRMLISAWVKVGGNDCKCSTYTNNKIRIRYTGSSEEVEFTPAGSIIEGWQRYEGIFIIPEGATKITVDLMNTGPTAALWFDDVRIHPFNANMKSFVYNPQSLRLMSELDENNYASFYEYDDDGTLSRVKKETQRGVKTITETRSHLQKAVQ